MDIVAELLKGNKLALARAITRIENQTKEAEGILCKICKRTGKAFRLGITGPPGAGKSTLSDCITRLYRKEGKKVGIIAVDPTSPFSGGALLGDRIRMQETSLDAGVFFRSMASRGSLGGLCQTTVEAADLMDAAGYDVILIETVGVGQSELDIMNTADTVVVAIVPESGDGIQTMKAGLMEIADIFCINKSDREGADRTYREIQTLIEVRGERETPVSVVQTSATKETGLEELFAQVNAHNKFMQESGEHAKRRLRQIKAKIHMDMENEIHHKVFEGEEAEERLDQLAGEVAARTKTTLQAAREILEALK